MSKWNEFDFSKGTYACRFDAVLRAGFAEDFLDDLKIRDAAKIKDRTWINMRNPEKRVHVSNYKLLGDLFQREPTSFLYYPKPDIPEDDIRYVFANRVDELVGSGRIPMHINEHPTDVVAYVWQMGDHVLQSLPITYLEQMQAYRRILRDDWGTLKECILDPNNEWKKLIGKMEVELDPFRSVEDALDWRESTCHFLQKQLKRQYNSNKRRAVFDATCRKFSQRLIRYRSQAKQDQELLEISGASIRAVIKADFHVRKVFLQDPGLDSTYASNYKYSHRMIRTLRYQNPSDFATWWNWFRDMNTKDLIATEIALNSKPPKLDDFLASGLCTIERTRRAIRISELNLPLTIERG